MTVLLELAPLTLPVRAELSMGPCLNVGAGRMGLVLIHSADMPRSGPSPLAQAVAELKAEVRQVGLTDAEIDAELAAYDATPHPEATL